MSQADAKPGAVRRKTVLSLLLGGVAGALASVTTLWVIDSGTLGELDTSRAVAVLVGVVYLVCAAGVGFGVASPGAGSRFLNVEDADELREQRGMLANSAISTAAMGLALMLAALAAPSGPVAAPVALAGVLALLSLACILSWRQRKRMDEFMQQLSHEAGAAAFYMLAIVGGGWALLAHLGYLTGPRPLDWLSLFVGLLLVSAMAAAAKRGLMVPR